MSVACLSSAEPCGEGAVPAALTGDGQGETERLESLLLEAVSDYSQASKKKVEKAVCFSKKAHLGQKRKSGEDFFCHPLAVAISVAGLNLDDDAVCAALLHDVVEDCGTSLDEIGREFGKTVEYLVAALTKIESVSMIGATGKKRHSIGAQNVRKVVVSMGKDIRAIVIKLCDRLHNMRTASWLSVEKQRRMAMETREIYAPLALRLGMGSMWKDLLGLCFEVDHPWRSRILNSAVTAARAEHEWGMAETARKMEALLLKNGITGRVVGRWKDTVSCYEKMRGKHLRLREVLDREGFRVVVSNRTECYVALGLIHSAWKPSPGWFKDYLALPKANGYQSLHTVVIGLSGFPMEIQIRTEKMEREAEMGVASHLSYKEGGDADKDKSSREWIRALLELHSDGGVAEEFLDALKTDLVSDEMVVFTPEGDPIALPRGSCALDFAFAIHSDLGLSAQVAVINGEDRVVTQRLRSGDVISIRQSGYPNPERMWLWAVKTARARSRIRGFLRLREKKEAHDAGLAALSSFLDMLGIELSTLGPRDFSAVKRKLGMDYEECLEKIAYGALSPAVLAEALTSGKGRNNSGGARRVMEISGEETDFMGMGKCCGPLPPDDISGVLLAGVGLEIHRKDCQNMARLGQKGQLIDAVWSMRALTESFSANIKVKAKNERGSLARITSVMAAEGADIGQVRVGEFNPKKERAMINFELMVRSKYHLDRVIDALKRCPDVINVF